MDNTTTKQPDTRAIRRRRRHLAVLVLADRYAADPALAAVAQDYRELVHRRQAVQP